MWLQEEFPAQLRLRSTQTEASKIVDSRQNCSIDYKLGSILLLTPCIAEVRWCVLSMLAILATPALSRSEQVTARHAEGLVHGFLSLRTLDGELLADGDLLQTSRGTRVTSRLVFTSKTDRCTTSRPCSISASDSDC